jgi:E3 ubiquitin-protein ligase BAH
VCDGSFFPSLLNEMSAVVGCFNEKAKKLLQLHLASGFKKYTMWFTNKGDKSHGRLIRQAKDLVTYAIINAVAMRKILKKYDKARHSTRPSCLFIYRIILLLPQKNCVAL